MAGLLLLACQLILVLTFVWSVASKLRSRDSFTAFRRSLPRTVGAPASSAGALATTVVAIEAVTAGTLLLAIGAPVLALPGFILASGLLAAFTAAMAVMIRRGVREPCHCFGINAQPPGPVQLIRNLLLFGVAVSGLMLVRNGTRPPSLSSSSQRQSALNGSSWSGGDMPYLPVILVAVTVLCVLNTALIIAVLSGLRQQSKLLRISIEGVTNPEPIMLAAGGEVSDFDATTVDGERVSRDSLQGNTLVAFVSPSCPACAESLPGFLARAESVDGGREQVLAVVMGDGDAARQLCAQLAGVARVINEPERGPVARAFRVDGYPAFALLSGDTVVASDFVLDRVPETAPL